MIRYDVATDKHQLFDNQLTGLLSNGIFHVSRVGRRMVVGTYGGGLSVFDPAKDTWRNYNIPDGLADQFVYDVQQVRNGDVWIATWSGANRCAAGPSKIPANGKPLPSRTPAAVCPIPGSMPGRRQERRDVVRHRIQAGPLQNGKWDHWQHADGLGAPYEQVKEAIQFTSDPGQSSSHHAQQKVEQGLQDVNVAYNPNYIISLAVTDDGVVWCGTWGGGLARFDGKTWRNFTTQDGLPPITFSCCTRDRTASCGPVPAGVWRGSMPTARDLRY